VRYHSLFTFLYSKREGTKAADLPDDTPYSVKQKRFDRMLALQRNIGMEHHQNLVGHTVRVLAEGKGKTAPGRLTGKNEQGVIVEFDGEESLIGNFVSVRVTQALQWAVVGTAETME
jgi:tRNA-2-methylthio-N6-dimethylallyladenosine synthase